MTILLVLLLWILAGLAVAWWMGHCGTWAEPRIYGKPFVRERRQWERERRGVRQMEEAL